MRAAYVHTLIRFSCSLPAFLHVHCTEPEFTSRSSLVRLYIRKGLSNASQMNERLLSYVQLRHQSMDRPRLMAWIGEGRGSSGDGLLVFAEYDARQLAVATVEEETDTAVDSELFTEATVMDVSKLESVDFPEDSASMLLSFDNDGSIERRQVSFYDDAARQQWRLALKQHFIRDIDASGTWKASQLPSNQHAKLVYATKLL